MKVCALLPLKLHSERVPGKNWRCLAGRPLYQHILGALLDVPEIDQIVINTDNPIVASPDPRVVIHRRPKELRGDRVPMHDIIAHDVRKTDGDVYLQTHATNPFITSATISRAIAFFHAIRAESVFSVTEHRARFWFGDLRPINHDPAELLPTQELTPVYEENSCLYLFRRDVFLRTLRRTSSRSRGFPTPVAESLDIDTEEDWALADNHRS